MPASTHYACDCNADQKSGFLRGVHNADCRSLDRVYPEICVDRHKRPTFPAACPACGAAASVIATASATYACGGTYGRKSQIQTHTDKWWGICGK